MRARLRGEARLPPRVRVARRLLGGDVCRGAAQNPVRRRGHEAAEPRVDEDEAPGCVLAEDADRQLIEHQVGGPRGAGFSGLGGTWFRLATFMPVEAFGF